jgi:cytochrome c biogenesis protein CcmG, thiol:disulfide interchange protein DsbE
VNKHASLILAIVLALGGHFLRQDNDKPADLPPGSPASAGSMAPEFTLVDLSGRKIDPATYRGRVVLLNFWATWCSPCREETPEFMNLQSKYGSQGLQVIGISLDDDAKPVLDFYRQFKMNYPIVIGDAGLAKQYGGILGLPVSFLIGCDGRIYSRYGGKADVMQVERELKPLLKAPQCSGKEPKE